MNTRHKTMRAGACLAALLAASPQDIAKHAGTSTPVPKAQPTLADLAARLEKVEAELARLRGRLAKSP